MKIVNLSHPITEGMPLFPGTREVFIIEANTIADDGFRQKHLSLSSHVGTHVDAPAHVLAEGQFLDELPLEQFYGRALVLDVSALPQRPLERDILKLLDKNCTFDFLLFYTGWQMHWAEGDYYSNNAPYLSEPLARKISATDLKGVGLDAPSVDAMDSVKLPVHDIFFRRNMIIIENLINLNELCGKEFILSVFPLNITKGDGSPVRAVAIIEE